MTLSHYTLNTGHLRNSPRNEVSRETVRALEPLLVSALESGKMIRVPDGSGARAGNIGIVLHTAPESLLATLYWQSAPGAQDIPFAFSSISWSEAARDNSLHLLTKTAVEMKLPIEAPQPMEYPVLLVLLLTSSPLIPPAVLMAAADLERCIAWTILAREGLAP